MFPLRERKIGGFTFGQKYPASFGTLAGHPHLGVDYSANYVILYMPFNGRITTMEGAQGGKTIWVYPDGQDVIIRLMHLSSMVVPGNYKEGEEIGVTGNTGSATTAPHLHADISKNNVDINNFNNFIDPEEFNWGGDNMAGFSDENMRLIIESSFRTMREVLLGKVDEKGLKADIELAMSQTKTGNVDAIAHQFEDYMVASDLKWVKKTDCDKACQVKLNEMSTTMSTRLDEQIEKDKEICNAQITNQLTGMVQESTVPVRCKSLGYIKPEPIEEVTVEIDSWWITFLKCLGLKK